MHLSSQIHMEQLAKKYLCGKTSGKVVDIGSMDIGGSYRDIFVSQGWKYLGADLEKGDNVDILIPCPYTFPFKNNSFDLLVSGQVLEHMAYPWVGISEMARVVKTGGLLFIIAPSKGYLHRYPVDCWRFYPDGFRALAKWANLNLISVTTDLEVVEPSGGSEIFGDTVGVFEKTFSWKLSQKLFHRISSTIANNRAHIAGT